METQPGGRYVETQPGAGFIQAVPLSTPTINTVTEKARLVRLLLIYSVNFHIYFFSVDGQVSV